MTSDTLYTPTWDLRQSLHTHAGLSQSFTRLSALREPSSEALAPLTFDLSPPPSDPVLWHCPWLLRIEFAGLLILPDGLLLITFLPVSLRRSAGLISELLSLLSQYLAIHKAPRLLTALPGSLAPLWLGPLGQCCPLKYPSCLTACHLSNGSVLLRNL